ncbi:hypothetical protein Cpir12675_001286 [Ceratocystis pirilliformis]|uniref:Protein DSF2 n=1 Tax=Ceratocystis pirilliformis TaxID=259994 RepID=A0ABR3ZG49_9PEZI
MDPPRPPFLELRSISSSSQRSIKPSMRSPRLHVAGEAPPELSPLDAFALQSRLLAKKLEESNREGRRMSRLPPLTSESPLVVQSRSEYFRTMSQDSLSENGDSPALNEPASGLGVRTEIEEPLPEMRPRSMHPRMSHMPPIDQEAPVPQFSEMMRGRASTLSNNGSVNFGARREASPEMIDSRDDNLLTPPGKRSPSHDSHLAPTLPSPSKSPPKNEASTEMTGLAPPRAIYPRRSSSILSGPPTDDDQAGSFYSRSPGSRKMSSSSSVYGGGYGPALGPRSPSVTPSTTSELRRPSFNFSRPISRAGTPSLDLPLPTRQTSSDSQPAFMNSDEIAHTPVSMNSEAFESFEESRSPGSTYIYSTYTLPRGKTIQRSVPLDATSVSEFGGSPKSVKSAVSGAPPSPPTRPSSSASRVTQSNLTLPNSEEDSPRKNLASPITESAKLRTAMSSVPSDTASTIRPHNSSPPTAAEMSAEEHLDTGIECHENGSLNESTYHLRIAAKQNNPTAMLLYALACRHGWGMRPNQKEGVEWLRRAAELAQEEIAEDEEHAKEGKKVNTLENKTRKAQFALSIYELGVSHMNGWGIEQDKKLALKCFEIAGTWGDVDALAEAGFCYAQGMGCKKDLKKSAKFYRMAEAKGMNMVGNSWIHKAKYDSDDESKKKKGKSRSHRHLFSHKSSS